MALEPKFVLPGQEIGTEEEYVAGVGTYVENAKIYAALTGQLTEENRTLSVVPKRRLSPMAVGTEVIGQIDNISDPVALVVVEPQGTEATRFGTSSAYCILHASYVKRGYVKSVRDELRIGDIIRARVTEFKNGEYHIATDDEHLGAIKAFCASCRHPLEKKPTGLQCPNCGRRENRKLADDYRS
ncbi:MAG: exosome complex RNA-binding protein Csl4 [Candidatus Micrarchaeota archaeon]|nr:exosome complex RNA-binding protein Csl4 [Candidatus Micrarchaeota archaeon]